MGHPQVFGRAPAINQKQFGRDLTKVNDVLFWVYNICCPGTLMSIPVAATQFGGEPFDQQSIKNILVQLCSQPANIVESHTLEVKSWCKDECQLAEKVSEAAACLANATGGTVIVGVEEEENKLPRFSKCRYPNVTKEWITQRIQDLTIPPVEQTTYDISTLLQDVTGVSGVNAFAVSVPRSKRLSGHLTVKGISKIRSGKECRPYYSIEDDRTKAPVPALSMSDLSLEAIQWGIDQHKGKFGIPASHWTGTADFVEHIGAVERYVPDGQTLPNYRITLAGLLFFGKQAAISKHFPSFETVVVSNQGPSHLHKNIVETFRELCASRNAVLPSLCPNLDMRTLRELLINAYIHRCYRINGPIVIRISESAVEIESPGELPAGLSVDNLIHCVPIYRNFLLAECGRYLGMCDKIGQGIDLVYSEVLSSGFGFPSFESEITERIIKAFLK